MDFNSIKINGYQIKKVLGHGGMATVYLAIQESFDRKVAIKIMAEQLSSDSSFRDRFLQEAKIVSRLIHPNIVTVYDVSVVNNHHYLSMEYIEGVDLKEKLHTISLFHLIKVIKEVALALDYAGRKGYVHRDIKPENIMINNEDGRAVLMDFGIAKAFDSISEMTQTGTAIGTPYYMSPEQAKGKEVDWRSDIYSLGVVFFQALTGQLPYQGDSAVSVGIMHLTDPIPELPEYLKDIFQPIIEKLMAKSPEDRYQNGEDIIKALNSISDDDLSQINTEYTKEGHRDSGENVNYNVSTPISNSGITSAHHFTSTDNEQDDKTKIINISSHTDQKKSTTTTLIISVAAIVILGIVAITFLMPQNDEKINALIESTKIIEQQLIDVKKKEEEELLAKQAEIKAKEEKELLIKQAKLKAKEAEELLAKQAKIKAKEEKAAQINATLQELLNKAATQEQQLKNNTNSVDELYQTYQLIYLIENEHPTIIKGYEKIKNAYLEIIEQQIVQQKIQQATNNLQKILEIFPELEDTEHIVSIKGKVDTANKVSELINQANKHLKNNNLSSKNNNNAYAFYKSALKLSPKNIQAKQGIINVSDKYYKNINQLINNKHYKKALSDIDIAEKIHPDSSNKFIALRAKIEQYIKDDLDEKNKNNKIKQLITDAKAQEMIGNIFTPKESSALTIYQQILKDAPNNKEALYAINEIEKRLLTNVYPEIASQNFEKAQDEIDKAMQYFPTSEPALSLQFELNSAIKNYEKSRKPKITKTIVKSLEFTDMSQKPIHKLKAERTIHIGFEFGNFGDTTNVLQAILYAGTISDKLSTTAVIMTKNNGVKFFKISRPVEGFAEGGYFIDFILNNEKVSSYRFSIEN